MTVVGGSDIADGVEQEMLAEATQWIEEIQLRSQSVVRDAIACIEDHSEPCAGGFVPPILRIAQQKDRCQFLAIMGNLKVLIARQGLSLEDIDCAKWHLANNTPMRDFSPEQLATYKRYLELAAAGVL